MQFSHARSWFFRFLVALGIVIPMFGTVRGEEFSLERWANDPLIEAAFFHRAGETIVRGIYPPVSATTATGAAGANVAYVAGESKKWFVEDQRGGVDLVEAGVTLRDESLIDLGIKVLNWGFARQNPAGGWDCPDAFHSATFFVEASARATLALQRSGLPKYQAQIDDWKTRLHAAGMWMNQQEVLASDPIFYQCTHRPYLAAAAFAETAVLTGDRALMERAEQFARISLRYQWPDGVNPEKGGYDVGYQSVGINYALRFCAVCETPELRAELIRMVGNAADFLLTKIDATGTLSTAGSVRMGHENDRSGQPKIIRYRPMVQQFVGSSLLTGEKRFRDVATLISLAQGWLSAEH